MAEQRMNAQALRQLPAEELHTQLASLRQELWQGRMKVDTGAVPQSHHVSHVRRQIARILTILQEHHGQRNN